MVWPSFATVHTCSLHTLWLSILVCVTPHTLHCRKKFQPFLFSWDVCVCDHTHRRFVCVWSHTHTHPGWGKIVGTFLVQCSTMHCVVKPTDRVLSQLGPIQCKGVGKKVWNLNLCVCATTLIILPMFIL